MKISSRPNHQVNLCLLEPLDISKLIKHVLPSFGFSMLLRCVLRWSDFTLHRRLTCYFTILHDPKCHSDIGMRERRKNGTNSKGFKMTPISLWHGPIV